MLVSLDCSAVPQYDLGGWMGARDWCVDGWVQRWVLTSQVVKRQLLQCREGKGNNPGMRTDCTARAGPAEMVAAAVPAAAAAAALERIERRLAVALLLLSALLLLLPGAADGDGVLSAGVAHVEETRSLTAHRCCKE